jgi:hypothetical protein
MVARARSVRVRPSRSGRVAVCTPYERNRYREICVLIKRRRCRRGWWMGHSTFGCRALSLVVGASIDAASSGGRLTHPRRRLADFALLPPPSALRFICARLHSSFMCGPRPVSRVQQCWMRRGSTPRWTWRRSRASWARQALVRAARTASSPCGRPLSL